MFLPKIVLHKPERRGWLIWSSIENNAFYVLHRIGI